ncbi:TPA: capsid protein, partial [Clostridioides difficile]|nr:capsid protein [Clostridioides difficile]HEM7423535.1 capsid protein [Clostridioides difficile]
SKLDEPTAVTEGKFFYFEESFEDVFILNKKADAIQFVVEA